MQLILFNSESIKTTEFQSTSISSPKTPKVVIVSPQWTYKSISKNFKKTMFEPLEQELPDPKRTKLEIPSLRVFYQFRKS